MLVGRSPEQKQLASLLDAAGDGTSAALVLRGEPGIGKTALLEWAAAERGGMSVLRGGGVEFEAELPFAGLSQILRTALPLLPRLPGPQRAALSGAFGLASDAPADRLLVGLAVLSLLAEVADGAPLLVLVDDAQWLDGVSAEALLFAARRLHAEGVVIVFAARDDGFAAPGLPELRLGGLEPADAAALLPRDLDPAVRYRVLSESHGNPLALLELPSVVSAGDPSLPLTARLQAAFAGRVAGLPERTRVLLLVAAAEETGDLPVILAAAGALGAGPSDLPSAGDGGGTLVRLDGQRLTFRHPLVRAAVYREAPLDLRLRAHAALAAALTDPDVADRRAWQLAAAATAPSEEVAAALEASALRARDRNGYGAASAAFERAARLTPVPADRAIRLLRAAETGADAGQMERAVALAEQSFPYTSDPEIQARIAHVEALAWLAQGNYPTAHDLLLAGADIADPVQAARMLCQAFHTAWFLGEPQLSDIVERLEPHGAPLAASLVAAVRDTPPSLGRAAFEARADGATVRELTLLAGAGFATGQDTEIHALTASLAAEARGAGAIGALPQLLCFQAQAELFTGRLRDAEISLAESVRIGHDIGALLPAGQASSVAAYIAALTGDEEGCRAHVAAALSAAAPGTPAAGYTWTRWALALLDLGQGRPESALARLTELHATGLPHQISATRSDPDLVEAAVRTGDRTAVTAAAARFAAWAHRVAQPWALSIHHRNQALLSDDPAPRYREALAHSSRPFEEARTHLLFGEHLRRSRRKAEARPHLTRALELFTTLSAAPWSHRARLELEATGTPAPAPTAPASSPLTPQELQITRLAARGLSNKDIAAQLFLSPKTVAYHLYKAYPKLGITSRTDLPALTL
ncbi:LuxR family transcriptional regulator [Actinocorallia longicatena]